LTALYLSSVLGAYDAAPLDGESFAFLLRSDLDDPTVAFERLEVIGRRQLPPTFLLRSAARAVDPFVLRGASIGAAWRADRQGARGAVFHLVGAGALPIASHLPLVVTLLDLAPWELRAAYAAGPITRFGGRLHGRQLRDAAAVIVGTEAIATAARRLLRLRPEQIHVVPLAPRPAFRSGGSGGRVGLADAVRRADPDGARGTHASSDGGSDAAGSAPGLDDAERLGLGARYLVYPARFDARQDVITLLRALAALAAAGRPEGLPDDVDWPPRIVAVGASPDDRALLARAAARYGVGDVFAYAAELPEARAAALVRGARAVVVPARSDATGFAALEAIAAGTPVVASAVGALPEVVGTAGLLVPSGEIDRLAVALRAVWLDDAIHGRLVAAALERATWDRRTWADVADATRRIYAMVGVSSPVPPVRSP
jgi:glycosyltransferase involved in cell wall biosynthesis